MDRNKIIQMARKAGLCNEKGGIEGDGGCYYHYAEEIERFAAAIRSATKEEDARICEERTLDGQLVHSSAVLNCAAAIRASK